MKNNLLLFFMASIAMSSCSTTEQVEPIKAIDSNGSEIAISFDSPQHSRAFGSGATEAWEKSVSSATLFACNATGKVVLRRDLTAAQISSSATTPIPIVVPGVAVGDNIFFAMVINSSIPTTADTQTKLLDQLENTPASYNGTYAEVSTAAKRNGGFIMTGSTTKAIAAGTTPVLITLKRSVAKVELTTKTSASFTTVYGAAVVKINSVVLSRASSDTYYFDRTGETIPKYSAGAKTFAHTQAPIEVTGTPKTYNNIFYIHENNTTAAGSRVLLTLSGIFDIDGNVATTTDQSAVTYTIELDGEAGGKILRNGAYKVVANINGVTGTDVTIQVSVANWETLKTQTVDLGK